MLDSEKLDTEGETRQTLLTEFEALREEILQRMAFQEQLIRYTMLATGTLVTIGLTVPERGDLVLLVAPILTVFFALAWPGYDAQISRLGTYIREHIEASVPGLGWERWHISPESEPAFGLLGRFCTLYNRGIFLAAQLLPLGLVVYKTSGGVVAYSLIALDIIALLATLLVVKHRK